MSDFLSRRLWLQSVFVAATVLLILLATSDPLPLTWDEGESIDRADKILSGLAPADWPFTVCNEGHPAGYGMTIALGKRIAPPFLSPKTSWRFGPMLLMAIALGAAHYRLARRYDGTTGLFAVAAILLLPRVFAQAHIAACDGPLTAAWLLSWSALDAARDSRKGAVLLGATLALTAAMKFTGLLAAIPILLALWLGNEEHGTRFRRVQNVVQNTAIVVSVAFCIFLALNPPLWEHPFSGLRTYVELNTHRREHFNITTVFLGRMYDLDHPLPWYNTLFWTAITVPVGLLILFGVGLHDCRKRRCGGSILLNMIALLLIRALPFAPPHDGVRLFLPAFPFLAIIAGRGAAVLCGFHGPPAPPPAAGTNGTNRNGLSTHWKNRLFGVTVAGMIYLGAVWNLYAYSPQWLSYYNAAIGGLPGAVRAGMEPTYWWDGLDRETLKWINDNAPEGTKVRFSAFSKKTIRLYQRWGDLTVPVAGPGEPAGFYVLQRRPSAEFPHDKELIENAVPVYTKRLFGVPLIEIHRL